MKILPTLLLLSMFLAAPAFAVTDTGDTGPGGAGHSESRQEWQARYAKMQAARDNHDVKTAGEMLAPDFKSVNITGEIMDRDKALKVLAESKRDPSKSGKSTLTSIDVNGKNATVVQHYDETQSTVLPGGKKITAQVISNGTDTWIEKDGEWKLQKTIVDDVDFFMDGKQVVHKTRDPKIDGTQ